MRTFIDSSGIVWDVWEVRPDHVAGYGLPHPVHAELQDGWLCFASRGEKRRLAPYPDHWRELSSDRLEALCAAAHGVPADLPTFDTSAIDRLVARRNEAQSA